MPIRVDIGDDDDIIEEFEEEAAHDEVRQAKEVETAFGVVTLLMNGKERPVALIDRNSEKLADVGLDLESGVVTIDGENFNPDSEWRYTLLDTIPAQKMDHKIEIQGGELMAVKSKLTQGKIEAMAVWFDRKEERLVNVTLK